MPSLVDWMIMSSREGFSYAKYLEDGSHAERVAIAIDSSTRKNIASNRMLSEAGISLLENSNIIANEATIALGSKLQDLEASGSRNASRVAEAIGGVEQTLSEGNELLVYSLRELRDELAGGFAHTVGQLDKLGAIFDQRLAAIAYNLSAIESSLNQLIAISKSPSTTWSNEQFELACDAFKRKLFPEALTLVQRAIDGHGTNAGNRLDHRYHYLRGLIYMGGLDSEHALLTNLCKAQQCFADTVRYAKGVSSSGESSALCSSSWIAASQGKFDEAHSYIMLASRIEPASPECRYLSSKLLAAKNKYAESQENLAKAICLRPELALRAFGDEHLRGAERSTFLISKAVSTAKHKLLSCIHEFQNGCEQIAYHFNAEYPRSDNYPVLTFKGGELATDVQYLVRQVTLFHQVEPLRFVSDRLDRYCSMLRSRRPDATVGLEDTLKRKCLKLVAKGEINLPPAPSVSLRSWVSSKPVISSMF